jgi:hypothetical protein
MQRSQAFFCLVSIFGVATAQTTQGPTQRAPLPTHSQQQVPDPIPSSHVELKPVIITRTSLDTKVVILRLYPRIATSIRLPEPVNSVVLGDPGNFQAEHSDHEPELVTVKPLSREPARTNLLISTAAGHTLNLLLVSPGEQIAGLREVDVLLTYGKSQAGGFLVDENPFSNLLVSDTRSLVSEVTKSEAVPVKPVPVATKELAKTAAQEASKPSGDASGPALDKLLARQGQAPLPQLYGQRPGTVDAGPRIKAGVSEVLDEGTAVVVLFSVVNPASHAIEILPPQVQLGGKFKKKWTTAEQLYVVDFRLSTRRVGAGQRADGVVVFERPAFKQSNETLFLQIADSGAVDLPALAPIGFGISNVRGGSAYESR